MPGIRASLEEGNEEIAGNKDEEIRKQKGRDAKRELEGSRKRREMTLIFEDSIASTRILALWCF